MAKRPRKPRDSVPPKIRHAMEKPSAKGATDGAATAAEDIGRYLSDDRTLTEPAPAPSPRDPATQRGPTPQLDYHHEAWERIREAGVCLRAFLQDKPRAIDLLNVFEEDVIKQTVGRGVLDRAATEAGKIAKAERKRQSEAKRKIPYPSVSGREFDLIGRTPGYPGE